MGDFMLIVDFESHQRWDDFIKNKMNWFKRGHGDVQTVNLFGDINIYVMKLRYSVKQLEVFSNKKIRKICKYIQRECSKLGVRCIIKDSVYRVINARGLWNEEFPKKKFSGQYLHLLLTWDVINHYCKSKRIQASDLSVCIVSGESKIDLEWQVDILCTDVKCIYIVAEKRDEYEDKFDHVFHETGTPISIFCDIISAIKNSNLMINLGSLDKVYVKRSFVKTHYLVFNCGDLGHFSTPKNLKRVDAVHILFPADIVNKLGLEVMKSFKSIELAEAIVINRLENRGVLCFAELTGKEVTKIMGRVFIECGFEVNLSF